MGVYKSPRSSYRQSPYRLKLWIMAPTVQSEAEKAQVYNAEYNEKYVDEPHVLEGFTVDPKVERRLLRKVTLIQILSVLRCRLIFD